MKKFDSFRAESAATRASACFPLAAVALAAACAAHSVSAQEARLATTVVTAARTETPIDEALAHITVITRAQIENMGAGRSLAEVLQRMAGVQISSNGGRGHTQSVFVRGAGSGQSLLLIDGLRYGSAISAAPVLANLPLELIERIEVLKGPASALYGSEAMGGVIQVFTKRGKGADQPFLADLSVTAGSYGHSSGTASLRGAQHGFDYQLGVSRITQQGQSAASPNDVSSFNVDRDAFSQTAANLALGYAFNTDWRLDSLFTQSEGKVFTDSGPTTYPYTEMRTQMGSLKLSGKLLQRWKSALTLGESADKSITLPTASYGYLNTRQTQYKWDNELATPVGVVQTGLERLDQKVDANTQYAIKSRTIDSAFVGLNGSAGRHSWQANLRGDDNSQFGHFTTYGLSYGLDLVQGFKVIAGHGKSMRAPSFGDLYGPWAGAYKGNPLLQPEQGKNNELALQWRGQDQQAKLTRYDNKIDNLITGGVTAMVNAPGTTRLKGWTLDYSAQVAGWDVAASLDQLDAKEASGLTPVRRAKHQATLRVDKSVGAWKLGASALYVGARGDNRYDASYVKHAVVLPAYTTVDIHAQYQLQRDWAVQGRIANLTDKQYETAYGFSQLGRAAYVTLKWTPR